MARRDTTDLRKPMMIAAGLYLREKRIASGKTQKQIAEIAGFDNAQYISNIERGEALPSPALMTVMKNTYRFNETEFLELLVDHKMAYYRELFFPNTAKKKS